MFWKSFISIFLLSLLSVQFNHAQDFIVPDIVHQIYDYPNPTFFIFLSLLSVQRIHKPKRHILWVNIEGRHRKNQWENWQSTAQNNTWENTFKEYIKNGSIEVQFTTFPYHPPFNNSIVGTNKAHRSDFLRMQLLYNIGGIYIDTDAYVVKPLHLFRENNFTIAFDNYISSDPNYPKRLNNGVLISSPQSSFLYLWMKEYANYNPNSFEYDSSVVPYQLALKYPDLVQIEMNRISPLSFGLQTSKIAEVITCGFFHPDKGFLYPIYQFEGKRSSMNFQNSAFDLNMYNEMKKKIVFHLTMTQVRGLSMMRKLLISPEDLQFMPSFLGHQFRLIYYGKDDFDYFKLFTLTFDEKLDVYKKCKDHFGMYSIPDNLDPESPRQQYTSIENRENPFS